MLKGLFQLANRLFNIEIDEVATTGPDAVQLWNSDVRFFNIKDATTGQYIASFYLDPYSRPSEKRGGAWSVVIFYNTKHTCGNALTLSIYTSYLYVMSFIQDGRLSGSLQGPGHTAGRIPGL